MFVVHAPAFSLEHTLESGQTFRWRRMGAGYLGVVAGGVVEVRQEGEQLYARSSAPERLHADWLRRYFALDLDLPYILREIDRDPQIHAAILRYAGLRIVRQESWECLASYILSSFNNIKRIEGMIARLALRFGARVQWNGREAHAFPAVECVAAASEAQLRSLGLGFRAAYLRDTARALMASQCDLHALATQPYAAAKTALLALPGVGDKVADCVLLFSHDHWEACPIDVWVHRALRPHFRRRPSQANMHLFARRHFGRYVGYAQQYLFHDLRMRVRPGSGGQAEARAGAQSVSAAQSRSVMAAGDLAIAEARDIVALDVSEPATRCVSVGAQSYGSVENNRLTDRQATEETR